MSRYQYTPLAGAQEFGETYIGRKLIQASPANREALGVAAELGYKVRYPDGYSSWSPKGAFDASYIRLGNISHLPDWHQRLIGEHALLAADADKLEAFLTSEDSDRLPTDHLACLSEQFGLMTMLLDTLDSRLQLLGTPPIPATTRALEDAAGYDEYKADMADGGVHQAPEAKQVFDPTGEAVEYSATVEASKPTPQG